MGRNLIVCTDGTWNTPDQVDRGRVVPSNVVKIARAASAESDHNGQVREQLLYYDLGVGTGGTFDKFIGGMTGKGLARNVMQAYAAIARHYRPGDRLYLFGFSRGAYTARSLSGMIGLCGIPDISRLSPQEVEEVMKDADEIYRLDPQKKKSERENRANEFAEEYRHSNGGIQKEIWFIGAWDTVGALGVPLKVATLFILKKYKFHDPALGDHIKNAFHALAIDERRGPFKPTLWSAGNLQNGQTVEQLWFPGVHTNIGGGYVDSGISDRALLWMCLKARDCGMGFRKQYLNEQLQPNYHGEVRDSMSAMYKVLAPKTRQIGGEREVPGAQRSEAANEGLHYSAAHRFEHPTQRKYKESIGAMNLKCALQNKSVPVATPMPHELVFGTPNGQINWNGTNNLSAVEIS